MSHVVSIAVKMTNLEAIKAACADLGLTFVPNQKTYRWFGVSMGDYPLPTGFTKADLGKCEHVIQVPGSGYDVGVVRARNANGTPAEGWTLVYDFWGPGATIAAKLGQNAQKFTQAYGVAVAIQTAKAKGYTYTKKVNASGAVVLTINT